MPEPPERSRESYERAVAARQPLDALPAVAELRESLGAWEAELARAALGDGETWETIGRALGTSRQAAWERLRPDVAAAIDEEKARLRRRRADLEKRRKSRGKP